MNVYINMWLMTLNIFWTMYMMFPVIAMFDAARSKNNRSNDQERR